MWPRIRSAQFGLLDDAVTLTMARVFSEKPFAVFSFQKTAGRFLPGYWLSNTLVYQFARLSPTRWFLVNFLVLLFSTWGIYWLVRLRSGTVVQSLLAGLFYCLSAATVESFYTLSKAERFSLLWLLAGVILVILSRKVNNRFSRMSLIAVAALFFLTAYITKEPTIVVVGIAGGWLITAWLQKRSGPDQLDLPAARNLFLLLSITVAIVIVARIKFVSLDLTGTYASNYQFTWQAIINQLWRWLGRFVRDFLYILPLVLGLLNQEVRSRVNLRFFLDSLIWMAGWMVIFLPWNVLEAYQTLPFSLGAAIIAGLCAGAAVQVLYEGESSLSGRIFGSLGLIGALILGQFTLVNNIYLARTQLLYDLVNSRMVKFLSKTPWRSALYFNVPPTEYISETAEQLGILRNRSDVNVGVFQYQRPQGTQPLRYYVITPIVDNMFLPNVRNSLHETGANNWTACFRAFLNGRTSSEYANTQSLLWIDFGFNRLLDDIGLKDLLSYNLNTLPFLATREMQYGWWVYKLTINPKKIAYPGIFTDDGAWVLKEPGGQKLIARFGENKGSPVTGDFDGDRWTDLGVYGPDTHQFSMDMNHDGQPDLEFQLREMRAGDVPVFGDWDGNGSDTPGFYRVSDSSWHIRNSFLAGEKESVVRMEAQPGGIPLAGDWDGDGSASFGMYYPDSGEVWLTNSVTPGAGLALAYTSEQSAFPVVADWYGFGLDTIALVKDGQWWIRPNNISCVFSNPILPEKFEAVSGVPVAGRWK